MRNTGRMLPDPAVQGESGNKAGQGLPEAVCRVGRLARRALLEEVYTEPKPGLVDPFSAGAHTDMDVRTFERSAQALGPWFEAMAVQGFCLEAEPEELFREIRKTGMLAEEAMYQATGGVNTHKGLIFTLGIFCAAAGRCLREREGLSLEELIEMQQRMTRRILTEELHRLENGGAALAEEPGESGHQATKGEENLRRYGSLGIRGEAIYGYPALQRLALPVLHRGLAQGRDWNQIKLQTLLTLMSQVEDSNIIGRHSPQVLAQVHQEAQNFLEEGGAYAPGAAERLREMDRDYIRRNISPGGCADLLAAAVFLILLLNDF